jgi:hypothetical protein
MGPLNSVELSPSSTGESRLAGSSPPVAFATPSAPAVNPSIQDLVEIANVPALVQIEPLQTANPTRFQSVLSDAIRQLREAEFQTTDPEERAYLAGLADRFQQLQEIGTPDSSMSATAAG